MAAGTTKAEPTPAPPSESWLPAGLAQQAPSGLLPWSIVLSQKFGKCAQGVGILSWGKCVVCSFGTRDLRRGGGVVGESTSHTAVSMTQGEGKPQNYHKAIQIQAWPHQSAKSDSVSSGFRAGVCVCVYVCIFLRMNSSPGFLLCK